MTLKEENPWEEEILSSLFFQCILDYVNQLHLSG